MSLILKGLDMPKYLNKPLRLEIHADGHVWIDHGTDYEYIDDVAIQIPKGHGRVGDLDLLKDMIKDSIPAYGIGVKIPTYGDMDIMDKIELIPTILETEE